MENIPVVSAIICYYNMEPFLRDSIESVLAQDFNDWELILVDDGSSDRSAQIAKGYALQHPEKIFCTAHQGNKNMGLSFSRNAGIDKARGKYICFLDADDIWKNEFLSSQLGLIEQHGVPVVCTATEYWYSWETPEEKDFQLPVGVPTQNRTYFPPSMFHLLYPLGTGTSPCICSAIASRAVIQKHGGFLNEFTGMYEDQAFWAKIFLNEPVYVSDECKNIYRQRAASVMHQSISTDEYPIARLQFFVWLRAYLRHNDRHNVSAAVAEAIKQMQGEQATVPNGKRSLVSRIGDFIRRRLIARQ